MSTRTSRSTSRANAPTVTAVIIVALIGVAVLSLTWACKTRFDYETATCVKIYVSYTAQIGSHQAGIGTIFFHYIQCSILDVIDKLNAQGTAHLLSAWMKIRLHWFVKKLALLQLLKTTQCDELLSPSVPWFDFQKTNSRKIDDMCHLHRSNAINY